METCNNNCIFGQKYAIKTVIWKLHKFAVRNVLCKAIKVVVNLKQIN